MSSSLLLKGSGSPELWDLVILLYAPWIVPVLLVHPRTCGILLGGEGGAFEMSLEEVLLEKGGLCLNGKRL